MNPWVDPYKDAEYFRHLAGQGDAELMAETSSPEGEIRVYASPALHRIFFAGLGAKTTPPPEAAVLVDGGIAGILLDPEGRDAGEFAGSEELAILDHTPQSIPYRLRRNGDVLILGDFGGQAAWLALRYGARSVTLVHGNAALLSLLHEAAAAYTGELYADSRIKIVNMEPHLFVAETDHEYDIIHMASAEGMPSGSQGLYGLMEERLLTKESVSRCLGLLRRNGILFAVRGLQTPPRDVPKMIGLFGEALTAREEPCSLVVGHNYLAAFMAIFRESPAAFDAGAMESLAGDLGVELDYHPGLSDEDASDLTGREAGGTFGPDPGPILRKASRAAVRSRFDSFRKEYVYDIEPATLDRPFFHNFFRWDSLGTLAGIYGVDWFRRTELGYFLVVVTLALVTVTGGIGIIVPMAMGRKGGSRPGTTSPLGRAAGIVYFAAIGAGFMAAEMSAVGQAAAILPFPVYALAAVLTGFMIAAGAGSAVGSVIRKPPAIRILAAISGTVTFLALAWVGTEALYAEAARAPVPVRFTVVSAWLLPRAFFMGWLLPAGLELFGSSERGNPDFSLYWASNGFASVAAVPAAAIVSISFGYTAATAAALGSYLVALCAALASPASGCGPAVQCRMPQGQEETDQQDPGQEEIEILDT